jgi:hypothetical protein
MLQPGPANVKGKNEKTFIIAARDFPLIPGVVSDGHIRQQKK